MRSRKAPSAVNARGGTPRFSIASRRRAQSDCGALTRASRPAESSGRLVSTASGSRASSASMIVLPMPRGGHVDDATHADVVVRVDDEPQVRERVLDLLALVEPHAADDAVGHAFAQQRVFNRARLGVRPVEHGRRRARAVRPRLADRARDEVRFLDLIARPNVENAGAAAALGPAAVCPCGSDCAWIMADAASRMICGRAVVLFEADDVGLREVALEVEDVVQVGAAPVDKLIDPDRRRRTDDGGVRPAAG